MKKLLLVTSLLSIIILSCGKKQESKEEPPYILENLVNYPFYADSLLQLCINSNEQITADSIKIIRPDKAREVLGEQTEVYLNHQMIGIASTVMKNKNIKIYAEVIQFGDEVNAYGFYALSRPDGIPIKKIGVECYSLGNSSYLIKGEYVVTLSLDEMSEKGQKDVDSLLVMFDRQIEANSNMPGQFMFFPYNGKIFPSNQYYPYQFLGVPRLSKVFTTSYSDGADTLVLFLTEDESGEKFINLKDYATKLGKVVDNPKGGYTFDQGYSIAFEYPGKGVMIAGLCKGKLLGAIGFRPYEDDKLVKLWLKGF